MNFSSTNKYYSFVFSAEIETVAREILGRSQLDADFVHYFYFLVLYIPVFSA